MNRECLPIIPFESVTQDWKSDSTEARVRRPTRQFFSDYPCLVSLSLYRAWKQGSLSLGLLTRDRETDQRALEAHLDRSEFFEDKFSNWKPLAMV